MFGNKYYLVFIQYYCISFLQFHNFPTREEKESQENKIFTLNLNSFITDVGTFHIAATQKVGVHSNDQARAVHSLGSS